MIVEHGTLLNLTKIGVNAAGNSQQDTLSSFIPLIEHCLTTTYFSYNNQLYE